MNSLIITGSLTKDPELRYTQSNVAVVSGTLAVQRAFKDRNGEKVTDFIDFVAWDKKALYLCNYAKKGDRLEIQGRLESRKYIDRDNQEKKVWECIVENVTSFSKREEPEQEPSTDLEEEIALPDDDLPF